MSVNGIRGASPPRRRIRQANPLTAINRTTAIKRTEDIKYQIYAQLSQLDCIFAPIETESVTANKM